MVEFERLRVRIPNRCMASLKKDMKVNDCLLIYVGRGKCNWDNYIL